MYLFVNVRNIFLEFKYIHVALKKSLGTNVIKSCPEDLTLMYFSPALQRSSAWYITYGNISSTHLCITAHKHQLHMKWTTPALTFSSLVTPPAAAAPESRGCISNTILNRFSEVFVKNSISAFGWRPYR